MTSIDITPTSRSIETARKALMDSIERLEQDLERTHTMQFLNHDNRKVQLFEEGIAAVQTRIENDLVGCRLGLEELTPAKKFANGREKLVHLVEILKNLPEGINFDMDHWGTKLKEDAEPWSCGFAGCAMGWAASDKSFKAAGLELVQDTYNSDEFDLCFDVYYQDKAAAHFFDIPQDVSDSFFLPMCYDGKMARKDITPAMVVERIERYLANPEEYEESLDN